MIISGNSSKRKFKSRPISFTQQIEREKWRSVLHKVSQEDCGLVVAGVFSAAYWYLHYCSSASIDRELGGRVFK